MWQTKKEDFHRTNGCEAQRGEESEETIDNREANQTTRVEMSKYEMMSPETSETKADMAEVDENNRTRSASTRRNERVSI